MLPFAAAWVEPGTTRVSEMSQAQKGKYYTMSPLYWVQTVWVIEVESRMVVAKNQGQQEGGRDGEKKLAEYTIS